MKISGAPKVLYLVLIIAVITIAILVFTQTKLPAEKKSQPINPISPTTPISQEQFVSTNTLPVTSSEPELIASTTTQPTSETEASREIDTSDWKIYINEKWGYGLKYPEDWYVKEGPEAVSVSILAPDVPVEQPYIDDSSKRIGITVFEERLPRPYFPPDVEIETNKKIIVGGAEGNEYLLRKEQIDRKSKSGRKTKWTKWILIKHNGIFYELIVSMENSRTVEIFNQMLKTFEFIE